MLSLQFVRENPDAVRKALRDRGSEEAVLNGLLRLDAERRELLVESEALRAERNELGKRIGATRDAAECQQLIDEMRTKSERIDALEPRLKAAEERTRGLLLELPNIPHPDTPVGGGEEENVVIRTEERQPFEFDFEPRPHWEIGERLGIIDFDAESSCGIAVLRAEERGCAVGEGADRLDAGPAHRAGIHGGLSALRGQG